MKFQNISQYGKKIISGKNKSGEISNKEIDELKKLIPE